MLSFTGVQSYLKLHRKERSRKNDLRSQLGIELWTSRTESRNCASSYFEKEENVSCFKVFKIFVCAVAPLNGRLSFLMDFSQYDGSISSVVGNMNL